MKIELDNSEIEFIVDALEARMREIGKVYTNSHSQDLEMGALKRLAQQLGYDFKTKGGNTGFTVARIKL
ncbi:TPA: hypothetical protein NJ582_004328 [Vibrio parahaemolyticus]|nr:hypothetical protein [Vibrio parahaemolyticus]EHR1005852.1 hypothetical protein [Vibrio parahaemolyticus]EIU6865354.1 hypothetical protein [Vibrio parahaemolyticus]EIU7065918.1 hypothetical protein [Vibrio parahaemolyticus]ELB2132375.1 hypothetical protein [Vibrio parahaemolyticus]